MQHQRNNILTTTGITIPIVNAEITKIYMSYVFRFFNSYLETVVSFVGVETSIGSEVVPLCVVDSAAANTVLDGVDAVVLPVETGSITI